MLFLKNNHEPAVPKAKLFSKHARDSLGELTACHLKQLQNMFSIFGLLLNTKIQQNKIVFNSSVSLSIKIMRAFDYKKGSKTKSGEMAELQVNHLVPET